MKLFPFATVAAALLVAMPASAHDFTVGNIEVNHPWSRQSPPGARVGAGYFSVTNRGTETERLVSGSSDVAAGFEFHVSETVDGVARMRPVEGAIEIAPGETVVFEPGATHVMLTGLQVPIVAGQPFAGSLVFEKAGPVEVEFTVERLGAPAPAAAAAAAAAEHSGH